MQARKLHNRLTAVGVASVNSRSGISGAAEPARSARRRSRSSLPSGNRGRVTLFERAGSRLLLMDTAQPASCPRGGGIGRCGTGEADLATLRSSMRGVVRLFAFPTAARVLAPAATPQRSEHPTHRPAPQPANRRCPTQSNSLLTTQSRSLSCRTIRMRRLGEARPLFDIEASRYPAAHQGVGHSKYSAAKSRGSARRSTGTPTV